MLKLFKKKLPLVRIKQFLYNPYYMIYWLKRFFIYKKNSYKYLSKFQGIKQLTPQETLDQLIEKNKSLARFFDGELGLVVGAGIFYSNKWSQKWSKKLAQEIKNALRAENEKILIGLPPFEHFKIKKEIENIDPYMYTECRMELWKYLDKNKTYASWAAFIEKFHEDMNWEKIKKYLDDKNVVIITGNSLRLANHKIGEKTFLIEGGMHNAFARRKEIFKNIQNLIKEKNLKKGNTVFMISLGPTAYSLIKMLSELGFTAWDTGHFFDNYNNKIKNDLMKTP